MVKMIRARVETLEKINEVSAGLFKGAHVAFGVFDGVHKGHQFLIDSTVRSAVLAQGKSVVLTFDRDPDELFCTDNAQKLLSNEERIEMLARSGVDIVVVLHFDKALAAQEPLEFLERLFRYDVPQEMHVGIDVRFGVRASGSVSNLKEWGNNQGCTIRAHELALAEGRPITATHIRYLLRDGHVEKANELLGYPYHAKGIVVPGRGAGSDFGFSTANLHFNQLSPLLGEGVYGGRAFVDDVSYKAAITVGVSPVFKGEATAVCEVHLLDFEGDIYGKVLGVEFLSRIRPMIKFGSVEELIAEVKSNIEWIRANLEL